MLLRLALFLLLQGFALATEPLGIAPNKAVRAEQGTPIPSAQAVAARLPKKGPLGEHELALMAIAKRPDLEKLRGAANTAIALKRAAHDLVNPELRLSYAEDNAISKGVLFRFALPHPWERKAKIQRAAAEVSLTEAEYYAGEDELVRQVRRSFAELAILQTKLDLQKNRKTGYEAYRDWLEERKVPSIGLDLAAARAKVYQTLSDIRVLESSTSTLREELAVYCGLDDSSRIDSSIQSRRIQDPALLDLEYLTSIAMLYRNDVLSDQARLTVARAQLSEVKAKRIPAATFIDLGYTQIDNPLRSNSNQEEWFARVGVSIPLWDWIGFNKQHQVHEAASQSLEIKIALQQQIICNEIKQAIKLLAESETQIGNHDKDLKAIQSDMQKSMDDAEMAATGVEDLFKSRRLQHEFKDLSQQMEISRISALSAYQEALMTLERALGIRVERALRLTIIP
jgi:outer membrane protein TolC